jgi:hypothetical protein
MDEAVSSRESTMRKPGPEWGLKREAVPVKPHGLHFGTQDLHSLFLSATGHVDDTIATARHSLDPAPRRGIEWPSPISS